MGFWEKCSRNLLQEIFHRGSTCWLSYKLPCDLRVVIPLWHCFLRIKFWSSGPWVPTEVCPHVDRRRRQEDLYNKHHPHTSNEATKDTLPEPKVVTKSKPTTVPTTMTTPSTVPTSASVITTVITEPIKSVVGDIYNGWTDTICLEQCAQFQDHQMMEQLSAAQDVFTKEQRAHLAPIVRYVPVANLGALILSQILAIFCTIALTTLLRWSREATYACGSSCNQYFAAVVPTKEDFLGYLDLHPELSIGQLVYCKILKGWLRITPKVNYDNKRKQSPKVSPRRSWLNP